MPYNLVIVNSNNEDEQPILAMRAYTQDQIYLCHCTYIEKVQFQLHNNKIQVLKRIMTNEILTTFTLVGD